MDHISGMKESGVTIKAELRLPKAKAKLNLFPTD